jgi:serine/threonine protein phosphatase PrpC
MFTNCVTKFAFATKTGQSPSKPNKTNQDAWITVPHFCGLKYCHFFSVADGHGQWGREVSGMMKVRLPQTIESEMRSMFKKYHEDLQQTQADEMLNTDETCIAFNNGFLTCNEELFKSNLDVRFSGSTCVSIMTLG